METTWGWAQYPNPNYPFTKTWTALIDRTINHKSWPHRFIQRLFLERPTYGHAWNLLKTMRQNLDLLEENLVVWWALFGQKVKCYVCPKPNKAQHPGDHPPIHSPNRLSYAGSWGCWSISKHLRLKAGNRWSCGIYSKVLTFRGLPETLYKNKCTNKPTVCLPEMLEHWPIWTQTLRVSLWKRKQDRTKQDVNGKPYLQPYFHPQDHNGLLGKFYHCNCNLQNKSDNSPQPMIVKAHRQFLSDRKAMKIRLCKYRPSTRIQ